MTKQDTKNAIQSTSTVISPDGTTISYLTVGNGPAVIVVPGALSLASDYAAFARALAEHFTVHIIERRGRGMSGPQGKGYGIAKECADLFAVQQKTGASLLVGHSFGGLVALEAARNHPIFARIAVYEPGVSIDGSIPANWIPSYEKKLDEGKQLDAFIEFIRALGPEAARKAPPWLMKLTMPMVIKSNELKTLLSLLQENLREHKEVIRLDNSYENYRQISASVLLMYGGKNHTPQTDMNIKRLAAAFQRGETQEFPALDHFGIGKTGYQEVANTISAYFLR